jgi:hypothetical protein
MSDHYYITDSDIPQSYYDFQIINRATESNDPGELEKLSRHQDEQVRARVAENLNTPLPILEKLAKDTHLVKLYLVRNAALPYHVLRQFMNIEDATLRRRVYERLLIGYRDGQVDLSGEDIVALITFLEPTLDNLSKIELIAAFHEHYDKSKGTI